MRPHSQPEVVVGAGFVLARGDEDPVRGDQIRAAEVPADLQRYQVQVAETEVGVVDVEAWQLEVRVDERRCDEETVVAAEEVGVVPKTVRRWSERGDFAELVRQRRESLLDATPTAKATLEAALSATTSSGAPDWKIRVAAAQTLMTNADGGGGSNGSLDEDGGQRVTKIYVSPDEDGEDR